MPSERTPPTHRLVLTVEAAADAADVAANSVRRLVSRRWDAHADGQPVGQLIGWPADHSTVGRAVLVDAARWATEKGIEIPRAAAIHLPADAVPPLPDEADAPAGPWVAHADRPTVEEHRRRDAEQLAESANAEAQAEREARLTFEAVELRRQVDDLRAELAGAHSALAALSGARARSLGTDRAT